MFARIMRFAAVLTLTIALLPTASFGRQPKKYQVTGKVLEVSADLIIVQKDDEKWEIARDASTKVVGELKVGAKVTIEYRMAASDVEVKKEDAKGK